MRAARGGLLLCLVAVGCGRSTASWAEQARSPDPAERLRAVRALGGRVGEAPAVVPVLVEKLRDEDAYVRRDAARALGPFGGEAREAVPALQGCLRDREPGVRRAARQALERIAPGSAPSAKRR